MAALATGVQTIPGNTGFTKAGLYQFPIPKCNRLQYKRTTNFRVICKDGDKVPSKGNSGQQHGVTRDLEQVLPKTDQGQRQGHKASQGQGPPPKTQNAMTMTRYSSDAKVPGGLGIARKNEVLGMIAAMKMIGAHQANTHLETAEHWNGRFAMFGNGYQ